MAARKYSFTQVKKGDYIVPANDGLTLWRINSYEEEGPRLEMKSATSGFLHLNPPTRTRWQAHRFHLTVAQLDARYGDDLPLDFLDWDQWEYDSGDYPTRAAVVKAVIG